MDGQGFEACFHAGFLASPPHACKANAQRFPVLRPRLAGGVIAAGFEVRHQRRGALGTRAAGGQRSRPAVPVGMDKSRTAWGQRRCRPCGLRWATPAAKGRPLSGGGWGLASTSLTAPAPTPARCEARLTVCAAARAGCQQRTGKGTRAGTAGNPAHGGPLDDRGGFGGNFRPAKPAGAPSCRARPAPLAYPL